MKLKLRVMKNNILENSDIKERVKKGLDITLKNYSKPKVKQMAFLCFLKMESLKR